MPLAATLPGAATTGRSFLNKKTLKGKMCRKLVCGSSEFTGKLIKKHTIADEREPIGWPNKQANKERRII